MTDATATHQLDLLADGDPVLTDQFRPREQQHLDRVIRPAAARITDAIRLLDTEICLIQVDDRDAQFGARHQQLIGECPELQGELMELQDAAWTLVRRIRSLHLSLGGQPTPQERERMITLRARLAQMQPIANGEVV